MSYLGPVLTNKPDIQVEELKTSPNETLAQSAPALAAQALDRELNAGGATSTNAPQAVNDLTGIVKKKKKAPTTDISSDPVTTEAEVNGIKRKAEDEAEESGTEKKARLESS